MIRSMGRIVFVTVCVLTAAITFYCLYRKHPVPLSFQTEVIESKTPSSNKPIPQALAPKALVPKIGGELKLSSQNSDTVPFVVEEGYAIAFGDVILGVPEKEGVLSGNFTLNPQQSWDKPEIPFVIDAEVPNPERISQSLGHIESKTGVRFIPLGTEADAIIFKKGDEHCQSVLGRQGGRQPIRISQNCTWHEITHEVLHAFGFIHEQSRFDRDNFIEILWDKIESKYHSQFQILPEAFLGPARDTSFDYHSIMLYNPWTFAVRRGEVVMRTRTNEAIDPSQGLSPGDIARVRALFRLG